MFDVFFTIRSYDALISTSGQFSTEILANDPVQPMFWNKGMGGQRKLHRKLLAREQSEGVGARVRRSIGTSGIQRLDPFLLLDEFKGEWPAGFPDHPHRGFETVSYMIEGCLDHEDFTGTHGRIVTGGVQWMTAGRGIVHSEIPAEGTGLVRGLQLWVNLKASDKMVQPRYQEKTAAQLIRKTENGITAVVVAGECMGVKSEIHTLTPAHFIDFILQPGSKFLQPVPPTWNAAFYVIEGSVITDATTIGTHELAVFPTGDGGSDSVAFENPSSETARLVYIAGEPIKEPVEQHGPFVMNTRQQLMDTMRDYQMGINGYEGAPGWHSKQGTEALRAQGRV